MRFLSLWLLLGLPMGRAEALEVWLASSENCNACAIYERVAQQRGYGRALQYPDRGGLTIPILSTTKNVLAADVVVQLPEDLGPKNPFWDVQLLVLVMDVDRVVFAGNIAESADNRELRQPDAVMFPPASPAEGDPSLVEANLYPEFFASHWNLEYFVDVALGKQPKRVAAPLVDLASPAPAVLGERNVILWGSAGTPLANALFIPTRMTEIRTALEGVAALGSPRFVTLFGHGPAVQGNDTSYIVDGRTQFQRADLAADYAADAAGVNSVLTGVLQAAEAHTLLVQVGHSGPTGAPLWGHGLTIAAADLEPLERDAAGELVMVSGACNSGQFVQAAQCGFFAAHPDVRAAGCQLSPEALGESDDYLRYFFRAATGAASTATGSSRSRRTPAVTLYDAHWYASTRLEDHQLSYTTTDALIDEYFAAHADALPASMTVAEIQAAARTLARALTRAEADAVAALTAGLAPDLAIPLTGYVDANHTADAKLADARELSSAERNRIIGLPYKLMLPLLARRIAYARLDVESAEFALAASCEQRSLQQFLGADSAR